MKLLAAIGAVGVSGGRESSGDDLCESLGELLVRSSEVIARGLERVGESTY